MTVAPRAAVGKAAKTAMRSSGSTRHLLPIYYALAAFTVFTVAMSLYLNHRIMAIYTGSVELNQGWAQRLIHYSELGQLAAAVDASRRALPTVPRLEKGPLPLEQVLTVATETADALTGHAPRASPAATVIGFLVAARGGARRRP